MARSNGKTEAENLEFDVEHELPAAEDPESENPTTTASQSGAEGELQKLKAERDTLLDRLARSQAEFDNARKRAAREQQEYREYAVADAVKALLPTLDSFERALDTAAGDKSEFRGGVELIYKQLQDALAKLGVQPIQAKGEPFDPNLHQAIEMVDTTDVKDHHVFEELQRGYKFKDRLLRPSMVKVARDPRN
jgi:molecular chaperone GrpE